MRHRTKIYLTLLLGLGVFASICAAMTCYQLHAVAETEDPTRELSSAISRRKTFETDPSVPRYSHSSDTVERVGVIFLVVYLNWLTDISSTEMWVVIIAGSIPPTWPLFRALTSNVKSQQSDKKSWRSTSTPNTTATRKSYDRLHGADMAQSDVELGRYPGAYGVTEPISKPHLVYTSGLEN